MMVRISLIIALCGVCHLFEDLTLVTYDGEDPDARKALAHKFRMVCPLDR